MAPNGFEGGLVGDWLVGLLPFDSTVSYMVGVAFFLSSFIIFTRLSFVYLFIMVCVRVSVPVYIIGYIVATSQ